MRTNIPRPAQVERLEPRRLLSTESSEFAADDVPQAALPLDDPAVAAVNWNGQEAYARKGEWIAQFDGIIGAPAEQVRAIQGLLAERAQVAEHLGSDGLVLLQASQESDPAAFASVPGLRYAEPNFADVEPTSVPDDPLFGNLWGLHNVGQLDVNPAFPGFALPAVAGLPDADIDAPEAWDLTTGGQGFGHGRPVVVGVIDSGVDYTHPDLAANVWQNVPELHGTPGVDDDGNGFVDDVHGYDFVGAGDPDPMDENGHGTHVSGTIGGVGNNGLGVAGINHRVQIMPLRFMTAALTSTAADAVEAINYATMMRKRGVNIRLTNNSWGGVTFSAAIRDAIAASNEAGLLFVTGPGNNRVDTDLVPFYPSSYDLPNIISAAITTSRDEKGAASSWGARSVDLGAPGRNILSTTLGGGYRYLNGSSMSAAHVSGVAALGWGLRPGATYADIKDAILAGADRIPSMNGITVTGGRLNAFNTLRLLLPGATADVFASPDHGPRAADADDSALESATAILVEGEQA